MSECLSNCSSAVRLPLLLPPRPQQLQPPLMCYSRRCSACATQPVPSSFPTQVRCAGAVAGRIRHQAAAAGHRPSGHLPNEDHPRHVSFCLIVLMGALGLAWHLPDEDHPRHVSCCSVGAALSGWWWWRHLLNAVSSHHCRWLLPATQKCLELLLQPTSCLALLLQQTPLRPPADDWSRTGLLRRAPSRRRWWAAASSAWVRTSFETLLQNTLACRPGEWCGWRLHRPG